MGVEVNNSTSSSKEVVSNGADDTGAQSEQM
jgi:hypothetical protein